MLLALAWQDHVVILLYLTGMVVLGLYLARRQRGDEEYFLAGRRMPWLAVGVSVIASLLSSLTYLSEPGEVWRSGVTHVFGKMLAIPFEMIVVWTLCIPFMMRFRYTSAYEYLGDRFGPAARRLGVALFILMVVLWMGFVVLASARALSIVSGFPLATVIFVVGLVATVYTVLGGLKAVIWTDVVQVALLIGGGLYAIGFVAAETGTFVPEWYETAAAHLQRSHQREHLPFFRIDPFVRATVVTVALNMCIWHICTHTANQMTVQRYFSTSDAKAARRSFVTASLFGVGLNLMLTVVGLAMLHYYVGAGASLDGGLDPSVRQDQDLIFPTFAVNRLTPGFGGAIIAALLAAAMSSIDSGVNSIATVLTVELRGGQQVNREDSTNTGLARLLTLGAGLFITIAAYLLDFLPGEWGIVDAMPRTFNAVTAPLGGMFLAGMFLPWVGQRGAVLGVLCGLTVSVGLGYFSQISSWLVQFGLLQDQPPSISFTWIMPCSLLATLLTAGIFGALDLTARRDVTGFTWFSRSS